MPGRLLESSRPKQWSLRSALPSVLFHGALILLAVRATARATEVFRSPDAQVHFFPTELHRPEPAAASTGGAQSSHATPASSRNVSLKTSQLPTHIAAVIPSITPNVSTDVAVNVTAPGVGDFKGGIAGQGNLFGNGGPGGHGNGLDGGPNGGVFGSDEVDRQAYLTPGSKPPYPEVMRTTGIEGIVLAQFIVDTTGRVERSSIRVISATNETFAMSVRAALPKFRFLPAERNQRKVSQLVQQAFTFKLNN